MMAAVRFAREIGTPLDAHATIHWLERMVVTILTIVDASQNYVQAFDKSLKRCGVALTCVWVRERLSR